MSKMNVTTDGEMNATVRAVNFIFEKPIEFKRKYATSNGSNTTNTTIDLEAIDFGHCSGLEDEANAESNKSSVQYLITP